MIGKYLFAGLVAVAAVSSPASAQTLSLPPAPLEAPEIPFNGEPERVAIARQIIDLGMPKDVREATFFAVVDQMIAQMRIAQGRRVDDPGAEAIIERHVDLMITDLKGTISTHIPDLMEAWAHSYANIFSTAELEEILAFVSTPTGAKFFQLSPAVIAEQNFATANQIYMNEVAAKIPTYQEALMDDLFTYLEEQEAASDSTES
ncbi:DUF2059 domain-containing protein [Pontixanthobacter aestiaquae]|uniref:DUF2059 domain-containing protein n=1 Tax=Pontixanthobacter aestiaquae TaxID=1509367 RepID=A0A844Z6R6_9SPHN|nr:DUF2059 domain-containing protein [Pontixanthobacter aestiaquae]MDN3645504.1 DUF2059 domain-containing protein [Pontixanthobacter aestiaquae]MXO83498.1 DUF2059 domain-containing protein [Pontixanthobacter aestiaquae]